MRVVGKLPCVLIVDDEPSMRRALYQALRRVGATVWVAADGATAMTLLKQHSTAIDCALVNLQMPGMDGFATVSALRAIKPGLPCLLVTGAVDIPEGKFVASGAVGVLPRPFTLEVLYRAVANLVAA